MKKTHPFSDFRLKLAACRFSKPARQQTSRQWLSIALGTGLCLTAGASHFDGSRTTPVHRIPLTAEDGQQIICTLPDTMPFSTKMTCGACHDYETIHGGTHFKGAGAGRPAQPWIVVDETSGTQIPADRMNLSPWEFTKQFGSHLPGGALSDPADKLADPDARWVISGGLEINCLACHNNSPRQDMTEWAKQIGRENFRWAATAASGFGDVGGMASRMPDWWDMYMGGSPDDKAYRVPPTVDYDTTLFDSKHRAWMDIGRPMDRNCLQCHSTHPVNAARMDVPGDVHTAAGLSCVDCHRNGEDHQILRGTTETMSCAACHTEEGLSAGQAGAPTAHHKGIPPIHFKELTCTACHSGLKPGNEPHGIRTSRANKLGIYGRARWHTESPYIVEPVFVRNDAGKIEPRRMMWPAFWADAEGRPLPEETVADAAAGILDVAEQIAAALYTLGSAENAAQELVAQGEPIFISDGKAYAQNVDGGVDLIGATDLQVTWAWKTPSNMVSTIPTFDVTAEEIDMDAEDVITGIMNAFKPREIVLATQGRLFAIGEDGWLHSTGTTLPDGWHTANGEPLVSPFAQRVVVDVVGTSKSFNEEQVALMLKKIGSGATYIANGRMFKLDGNALVTVDHEAAQPVSWALGHDVRGAAQSLGAKSCTECHASDSAFLFGSVTATGPLVTDRAAVVPMHTFMKVNSSYNKLFGTTFKGRKAFKCVLSNLALLLVLIALAVGLPLLHKALIGLSEKGYDDQPIKQVVRTAMLVLVISGFVFGWPIRYPLSGFPLLIHVGFGALYALGLVVWAAIRAPKANGWFWLLLISGIVLVLSVLPAMFPLLGTQGQHTAMVIHRTAAVASCIAAVMGALTVKKK